MKNLTLAFAIAAAAAIASVGSAQVSYSVSRVKTESVGTGLNEAGAISWLLRRVTADDGRAIVKVLQNLEAKGITGDNSQAYGLLATRDLILANADNRGQLAAIWNNMAYFDKESFAILARDAYFNGIDETGPNSPTLNAFASGLQPFGTAITPEERILDGLSTHFSATGAQALREAIATLDRAGKRGEYANLGYVNAEEILVSALPSDKKDTFVADWQKLQYSEREAVATIVRDAVLGGLDDL